MLTYLRINLKWYLMEKPNYSKTEKHDTKNNCYIIKIIIFLINFNQQLHIIKATRSYILSKALSKYL